MALMAAPAEQKGLGLGQEVAAAVPERIFADPMRLRQVLTNLVSNATKFTEAGEVTVRVDYAGEGRLEVEVEDTGIGIAEAQREEIFQHFVQADNSLTRRAGGTGLGLAISRQLVELMGGTIGVRSVPGMGSTFAFAIRARPAPAVAPAPPVAAGRARRKRAAAGAPRRGPRHQPVPDQRLPPGRRARGGGGRQRTRGDSGGGGRRLRRGADGRADAGDRRPGGDAGDPRARGPGARCRSSR